MPSIVSITGSGIIGVDLGDAVWKIALEETRIQEVQNTIFYFGITYRYPAAEFKLWDASRMSLIRTPILVATEDGEVKRITDVALNGGSLEKDKERTKEAFELFKNRPRIKAASLEDDVKSAQTIVEVYWDIQEWIATGMKEEKEIIEADTRLLLRP